MRSLLRLSLLLALLLAGCGARPIPSAAPSMIATPLALPPTAGNAAPAKTSTQAAVTPSAAVNVITGHAGAVNRLAWSPDGTRLATAVSAMDAQDFTIRLWSADGATLAVISGHTAPVMALAWSPDGKTLASASLDGTTRLWSADGAAGKVLRGGAGGMFAAAWSPDGQYLATGSIEQVVNPTVQVWDSAGKVVRTLHTSFSGGKFYNLAWSPDGKYLLGGATDYKLWRADGTEIYWLQGCAACTPAWGMAWSPGSTRWAVGNENGDVQIYDVQGKAVAVVKDDTSINSLAWSPDGRVLAGAHMLWSADGQVVNSISTAPRYVSSVSWSPGGKLLASGGSEPDVHLYSPDGTPAGLLKGAGEVAAVAWSPEGKILAVGYSDGSLRLWKVN